MDSRRDLTRRILEKVGGGRAGLPGSGAAGCGAGEAESLARRGDGGRADALVAATSGLPRAALLVREVVSVSRWGFRADVLADDALAKQVCRYIPQRNMHRSAGLPDGEALSSVRAVVAASSAEILAKLALGIAEGPVGEAALWALWHGVPLYMDLSVADTAPDGAPCQNAALAALYAGCREKLEALGVRHAMLGEVCPAVLAVLSAAGQAKVGGLLPLPQGTASNGRVFITKKDVMAYSGPLEWALPECAAVTDAAREEAAQRKIVFRRVKGATQT